MSDSRTHPAKPAAGLKGIWLAVAVICLAGLALWAVSLALVGDTVRESLLRAIGTAGLTLAFGGVFGGLTAQMFKSLDARRTAQAAELAFYRAILDDIKRVHDQVERARLLIEAHKSAKTYGEQMRALPDADITLRNILRALSPGFPKLREEISAPIEACSDFIRTLTGEFRDCYKAISNAQAQDEATNRFRREQIAEGREAGKGYADEAWRMIADLQELKVLRDPARLLEYEARFLLQIDLASFHLRKMLPGGTDEDIDGKQNEIEALIREARKRVRPKPGEGPAET